MEVPRTRGLIVSGACQYPERHAVHDHRQHVRPEPERQLPRTRCPPAPTAARRRTPKRSRWITRAASAARAVRLPVPLNMRAGYRFRLRGSRTLQAHVDVFNVTNRANFNIHPNIGNVLSVADRRDAATFLILRIDPRRPDADRAVQPEVQLLSRAGRAGRAGGAGQRKNIPTSCRPSCPTLTAHAHRRPSSPPLFFAAATLAAQTARTFRLEETTIAQIQSAFRDGVAHLPLARRRYVARIDAHDKQGAALNAIVTINPDAPDDGRRSRSPLQAVRRRSGRCTACRSS